MINIIHPKTKNKFRVIFDSPNADANTSLSLNVIKISELSRDIISRRSDKYVKITFINDKGNNFNNALKDLMYSTFNIKIEYIDGIDNEHVSQSISLGKCQIHYIINGELDYETNQSVETTLDIYYQDYQEELF